MKILLVSMNNHHFKRWAEQLDGHGFELYWFDVLDQGAAPSLSFLNQITDWKKGFLKKRGRSLLKKNLPFVYQVLEHQLDAKVEDAFEKAVIEIQPDIVHCFEMKISGLKIVSVMRKNQLALIYSSWGTDLYNLDVLGIKKQQAQEFLDRVDYLITDCRRDAILAKNLGFEKENLGVFPGNGGLDISDVNRLTVNQRNYILIKGYESDIGKALPVIKALELLPEDLISNFKILIYSADSDVINYVTQSVFFNLFDINIVPRTENVPNKKLLEFMGKAAVHVANSLSDGMPNALLEAMGMGAFPIQSNPGKVTEEVITHGENGFLIQDPLDSKEIENLMRKALTNEALRNKAQEFNTSFIYKNYNRSILRARIVSLYKQIYSNHHS